MMVKRRRSCSAFNATVFYSILRVSTHVLLIPSHDSTQAIFGWGFYSLKYWMPILSPQTLEKVHLEARHQAFVERGGRQRQTQLQATHGSGVSTKKEMLMRERLSRAVHFPLRQQNIQMKKFTQTGLTAREVSQLQKYAHDSVKRLWFDARVGERRIINGTRVCMARSIRSVAGRESSLNAKSGFMTPSRGLLQPCAASRGETQTCCNRI